MTFEIGTGWFYTLAIAAVVSLVVAGLLVRTQHANARTLVQLLKERSEQLEQANQTLQHLSSVDGLTGIANRRHFDESLEMEWRRAYRAEFPLSLIMIDIDFFKAFNDSYGHQSGDEALKLVATALSDGLKRPGDLTARYGGEEFAVILQGASKEGAVKIAQALRQKVEALGILHKDSPANVVTVSLGVATADPRRDPSPPALLASADRALYQAKQQGRNRVVVDDSVASR